MRLRIPVPFHPSCRTLRLNFLHYTPCFPSPSRFTCAYGRFIFSCRARIEHLRIAGGVLSVGGRFILTNTPGFTVAHQGFKRGSINFDLAESLSRVVSNILRLRRE